MPDIEDLALNKGKEKTQIDEKKIRITKELEVYMNENRSDEDIKNKFRKQFQKLSRKYKTQVRKSDLVACYRHLISEKKMYEDPLFFKLIQKKPVRNTSGVNPITLMYSPYPNGQGFTCRYKCKYCQTHPEYPKSYGPEAPASSRGIQNNFEAIEQMNSNLRRLQENGHELDKLELNYEGGTFSEIPRDYILDFHRDTYYAANVFFDTETPKRPRLSIEEEMAINEKEHIRIIGMTIETRPDTIDADELKFFRRLGVTRVQIGVQHTDNAILRKSARGHTYKQAVESTHFLKMNGFKVVHHYMTALPYATPDDDMKMLRTVYYSSTRGRPHEIKIYPYSVVDYSDFRKEYDEGKFTLYSDEDPEAFRDVMRFALEKCPRDIRICRAVRDIPTTYILGGCKTPNLRQLITDDLAKEGKECNDMRSREISRRDTYKLEDARYYTTQTTQNDFIITLESQDRRALFGFLRLRFNYAHSAKDVVFPEIIGGAIIEELHVYSTSGMLVKVGERKQGASQHRGVGKQLLKRAESMAWMRGMSHILVISGEGVRQYYAKQGYEYDHGEGRFMIKRFKYILTADIVLGVFMIFMMGLCYLINLV